MRTLVIVIAISAMVSVCFAKDEMQVADLVKQSLNSIGTEQARAAVKNRAVEGTLQFRILSGGSGSQEGKEVLLTEGNKMVALLKLPNPNYHGERFVSDGKKTAVAQLKPGVYSNLGQFILAHNEILTEGLWGGALSTSWALAHLDDHQAKLKYQGLKKIDGRELHRLEYTPKHSDLQISLYFEPGTFRHVLTVYELTIKPQMGLTDEETAHQQATFYRLEERFADFKATDSLTLPGKWKIQFASEVPEAGAESRGGGGPIMSGPGEGTNPGIMSGPSTTLGGTTPANEGSGQGHPQFSAAIGAVSQFEVTVTGVAINATLDPKNFEVK